MSSTKRFCLILEDSLAHSNVSCIIKDQGDADRQPGDVLIHIKASDLMFHDRFRLATVDEQQCSSQAADDVLSNYTDPSSPAHTPDFEQLCMETFMKCK